MTKYLYSNALEEQRYGRNKQTVIDSKYINSGAFRKKFNNISSNQKLNRLLYKLSKQMLSHRSGTLYEDMYWIDLNSVKVIASELTCESEEQISYSPKTIKAINTHHNLLTIHSHPNRFPPSISDLNSNYSNSYSIGIIACHNGKIYMYSVSEPINETYYSMTVAEYLNQGYNENDSQLMALNHIRENFNIQFKEVTGDDV